MLAPDEPLDPPFDDQPYAALVWATVPTTDARKQRIADALIASGCRYVVCGGVEPDSWEEAADAAYLAQDLSEAEFAERHVTTTSHRGETEGEVAFFFVHCAFIEGDDFASCLVLLIGADDRVQARLTAAVRAEASGPVASRNDRRPKG